MRISKNRLRYLISEVVIEMGLEDEMQALINKNQYIRGQKPVLIGPNKNILESDEYMLFFSDFSEHHIKERHKDPKKPGSTFIQNINLKDIAMHYLNSVNPTEINSTNINWIAINNSSTIGYMGLAVADSREEFDKLEDYIMPDFKRELVKIKKDGKRKPTNELTMITSKLGRLSNGKEFLSLVTMFPGGMEIKRVEIPKDRSEFSDKLIYFVT